MQVKNEFDSDSESINKSNKFSNNTINFHYNVISECLNFYNNGEILKFLLI